ncbi:DUF4262 domain-containing protein [uncultured Pseudokineococcus sp.]|uniref:DUF4262 domain-containing protein n=1 Tax=uncultured Pseudokineococcus sp. TaxID=1642928 RepID=UPI002602705C|nr:DUF4262 domain-containing protein [uncultured Pseudokineococcus sp.]
MCELCPVDLSDIVEEHRQEVDADGFSIVHTTGGTSGYPLTYTVGLSRQDGQRDLLVSGAPVALSYLLVDRLARRVLAGEHFDAGDQLDDLGRVLMRFEPVSHPECAVILQAMYAEDGPPLPLLQVVWQDDHGRWPWEEVDAGVDLVQT